MLRKSVIAFCMIKLSVVLYAQPINDRTILNGFAETVEGLIKAKAHVPFEQLQKQTLRNIEETVSVKASPAAAQKDISGSEMYKHLQERTFIVAKSVVDPQYGGVRLTTATGYAISEEGVIVTNYHVIEGNDKQKIIGIFVRDYTGNVFVVTEVLTSSQANDLAVLKIDIRDKSIKALPLGNTCGAGEEIYLMGHPFDNMFFMTQGIIARTYISSRDLEVKMAVTADFGPGASGGPIVNKQGALVGMVSAISVHVAEKNDAASARLQVKEAIPVSVLKNYLSL